MMVVTNALGIAFTATLLSAGPNGATFVFPEDGATNTLAFSQLSPDSVRRVCEESGYVIIPPVLVAAANVAKRDLERIDALLADGRIDAETAALRRRRILAAFKRICAGKGIAFNPAFLQ